MSKRLRFSGVTGLAVLGLTISTASAAPLLRVQVDQKGDFVLLGNTLGYECAVGTPAPVVGSVGACGTVGLTDSAPDIFWRADSPMDGQAEAQGPNMGAKTDLPVDDQGEYDALGRIVKVRLGMRTLPAAPVGVAAAAQPAAAAAPRPAAAARTTVPMCRAVACSAL